MIAFDIHYVYARRYYRCHEWNLEESLSFTTIEPMDKVGIKSRASLKKHYLDPLVKLGLIEMTIPKKPMSKNQRYIYK